MGEWLHRKLCGGILLVCPYSGLDFGENGLERFSAALCAWRDFFVVYGHPVLRLSPVGHAATR
ncbi:hypothetical protein, partial [Leucobacter sp. OLCALW19]|uniref:hypothetical protein n=1 Tax=Leucobacter sp. OLCALW19 TaxID=1914915 RepID=UPI001A7E1BDB